MNKNYIIHHNDLDGWIGAIILKITYPDAELCECNYDNIEKNVDVYKLEKNSNVYMVDFSYKPNEMIYLKNNFNFYWIDHHVSAINDSIKFGYNDCKGIRIIGKSGAELAWVFCSEKPIPEFIKLVGDFDTFRNSQDKEFEDKVLPFFLGYESEQELFNPNTQKIFSSLQDFYGVKSEKIIKDFIKNGQIIVRWRKSHDKIINNSNAFIRIIDGIRFVCLNTADSGSFNFTLCKFWNPETMDAMMLYNYNGKKWCYGVYTDAKDKPDIDVSIIAKKYGGGGHRCAGGFITNNLIEELQ